MAKKEKKARKRAKKRKKKHALREIRELSKSLGHLRDDDDEPESE